MKTIEIYDLSTVEPTVIDAVPDERHLYDLRGVQAGDSLVLVDETDEQVEFDRLDLRQTVGELGQGKLRLMLLRNPRAKVTVRIEYAGDTVEVHVHAATRLRRVRKLACVALGLDDDAAVDTSLRLPGSEVDLPLKRPIGAYLDKGQHKIILDLVHKVRPQG